MQTFEDHFSQKAGRYAQYRPHYPAELFAFLAAAAPGQRLAWDCGTGNGQAARELVQHFERVIATDASPEQIAHAFPHARIEYRVEAAESANLEPHSVDLVTVATAVHWFKLEQFYETLRRVLVPGGLLAVWTYHYPVIDPAMDQALHRFSSDVLGGYWPERLSYVSDHYQSLPFPFEELSPPEVQMQAEWDLYQLAGFMDSWSGAQRYRAAQGNHATGFFWPELVKAWGEPERKRLIRWPLYLRVGRVTPAE